MEVHSSLDNMDIKSYRPKNLLQLNDRKSNIDCFSSLIYLSKDIKIFVDGTFIYCAKIFCQLFKIHAIENKHYILLIFFLLLDKSNEN